MGKKGSVAVLHEPVHADTPLWREALVGLDYARLKLSPVHLGIGVNKGDKSPVVVVPGFLGNDLYLAELYFWLWRIHYKPYMSKIGHNAECPNVLTHRLVKTVEKAYTKTGRRVHLVGHSLGGVLSRAAASQVPEKVASVITLGSPFRGVRVSPIIIKAYDAVHRKILRGTPQDENCYTLNCSCGFMYNLAKEFPDYIPHTSVYTKTDGVVDWETCVDGDSKADVEVSGTHTGLVWNPDVYKIIASRLYDASHHRSVPDRVKSARIKVKYRMHEEQETA